MSCPVLGMDVNGRIRLPVWSIWPDGQRLLGEIAVNKICMLFI